MQSEQDYIILEFDYEHSRLPRPSQQRSVLIKDVVLPIVNIKTYSKKTWMKDHSTAGDYSAIYNFLKNRNNHTTSDWNCIRNQSHSNNIVNRLERNHLKMDIYETIMILNPDLTDTEINNKIKKYTKILQKFSTTKKVRAEDIGIKKLAYDIKGYEYGHYLLFTYEAPSEQKLPAFHLYKNVLKNVSIKSIELETELEDLRPIDAYDVLLGIAEY